MKFLMSMLLLLFLTACQSILIQSESQYLPVRSDATIEILKELEVFPDSARAFLQQGQPIHPNALNLYDVNCEVELNTVSENKQVIKPGRYHVISVQQEESPIVLFHPVQLAAQSLSWVDDAPVDVKRYYYFRLQSVKAEAVTSVRAVICRGIQDAPYKAKWPTLEQMIQAGGQYLYFNL